jgi:S-DNA-T family DNA segregation ATPase FtsK/SpoIIIE
MDEISIGPSVTRYALKPAEGVKLSKIVALNNDLALALAAHPIRIEAPIPGKSLVGIEIPNTTKTTVGLASLLSSEEYQKSDTPLLISLGKGISGKSYFANLAKAPHMLVAGATGSGKSVTIHAIIASLLFRNAPENLKFIMIDPKRVELTMYNSIPHLLTPVITDPKKAILALKWAAKEMTRRYNILEKYTVRDIGSYHKNVLTPEVEKLKKKGDADEQDTKDMPDSMPYIVIVIDELADIMQTYPRELESSIVRLAQMSRAVGIHLILSTQRPSVNVITGLIKANVPTRVAMQVSSQIDSRTILDASGAEKLLGAGDMLYQGGEMAKPARLQSAYITESELKKVVKYLSDAYKDEIMGEINLMTPEPGKDSVFEASLGDDESLEEEDDMYEEAKQVVIESGKASTSYLQRKLGIGYSRAAKLIDILEERGIVGPGNGSKPREVLAGRENTGVPTESTDTL